MSLYFCFYRLLLKEILTIAGGTNTNEPGSHSVVAGVDDDVDIVGLFVGFFSRYFFVLQYTLIKDDVVCSRRSHKRCEALAYFSGYFFVCLFVCWGFFGSFLFFVCCRRCRCCRCATCLFIFIACSVLLCFFFTCFVLDFRCYSCRCCYYGCRFFVGFFFFSFL